MMELITGYLYVTWLWMTGPTVDFDDAMDKAMAWFLLLLPVMVLWGAWQIIRLPGDLAESEEPNKPDRATAEKKDEFSRLFPYARRRDSL